MRSPALAGARRNRAHFGITPASSRSSEHAWQGLSAQPLAAQIEFAEREHMPFPVIADPELKLRDALALPTFEFGGATLYKRVTLVLEAGRVRHVFYPVFPPDRNAADVIEWLRARDEA